jgi:DNA polymerase elongation subunit (family B)
MRFYTSVERNRNYLLIRGYEDGKRFELKEYYNPYLFVPVPLGQEGTHRNIHGKHFIKRYFDKMSEASKFIQEYGDVENYEIHGLNQYNYLYIYDEFPGKIQYDESIISRGTIDIETRKGEGPYAKAVTAEKEITLITIRKNGHAYTFGYKKYIPKKSNVTFFHCKDERDMLWKFLEFWKSPECDLDIITGWNSNQFDITYIHNRLKRVLGESAANSLSPWGIVEDVEKTDKTGRTRIEKLIYGRAQLDYQDLYKKFSHTPQEDYSLEHVANYELDTGKLNYSEYETLDELEEKDYQKFVDYNILDTELVDRLEEKRQFISLCIMVTYYAKCNFADLLGTVRIWDMIIHRYLMDRNICVPPKKFEARDDTFAGGYVKEVKEGMYKWVVTYDVSSLYPSLIIQYNISPEKLFEFVSGVDVDSCLAGILNDEQIRQFLEENDVCVTANGYTYKKDGSGFIPEVIKEVMQLKNSADAEKKIKEKELLLIEQEMKKRGLKIREERF